MTRPYLLLTEHAWDEAARFSSTLFWVIEEQGGVIRFDSQMTAWHDDEYRQLFYLGGFHRAESVEAENWPVSETVEGALFALLAQTAE